MLTRAFEISAKRRALGFFIRPRPEPDVRSAPDARDSKFLGRATSVRSRLLALSVHEVRNRISAELLRVIRSPHRQNLESLVEGGEELFSRVHIREERNLGVTTSADSG